MEYMVRSSFTNDLYNKFDCDILLDIIEGCDVLTFSFFRKKKYKRKLIFNLRYFLGVLF